MPFKIMRNNITKMHVDAIVNPTNSHLFGTAGVDGAIHKLEGSWLRNETSKHDGLVPGQAIITRAKNLPAKHIIHTVGPVWKSERDTEILRNCYKNSLNLAMEAQL